MTTFLKNIRGTDLRNILRREFRSRNIALFLWQSKHPRGIAIGLDKV